MRLGKLSFPVKITADDVREQVKELLEEKEWEEFEIQKPELWFFPYYVFTYNAFSESADESGVKTVSEGEKGLTAMNAQSSELEESIGKQFDELENDLVTKPSVEEFKVLRFRIQASEAPRLAQLKIASKLGMDKENVVISGLKAVYFPVWLCDASFDEEKNQVEFQIDGVSGELLSEDTVPFRGRTGAELVEETVSDLYNPLNWIKYPFYILKDILLFLWNNPLSQWLRHELLTNRRAQIAALILILLLMIALDQGYIQLPPIQWPRFSFLNGG